MSEESPETRLALLEKRADDHDKVIEGQRKDIESLKLWRGWITGSAATIMFLLGLFASQLKKILGN